MNCIDVLQFSSVYRALHTLKQRRSVGKLGRRKVGLGKLGLDKLGFGKVGRLGGKLGRSTTSKRA